jgi:hypothetical protein
MRYEEESIEAESHTQTVIQLISALIEDKAKRKDACGQIKLTPQELTIFREAGVEEGSFKAVSWLSSYAWFIARETFYSDMERYPGEYMDQVRAARK